MPLGAWPRRPGPARRSPARRDAAGRPPPRTHSTALTPLHCIRRVLRLHSPCAARAAAAGGGKTRCVNPDASLEMARASRFLIDRSAARRRGRRRPEGPGVATRRVRSRTSGLSQSRRARRRPRGASPGRPGAIGPGRGAGPSRGDRDGHAPRPGPGRVVDAARRGAGAEAGASGSIVQPAHAASLVRPRAACAAGPRGPGVVAGRPGPGRGCSRGGRAAFAPLHGDPARGDGVAPPRRGRCPARGGDGARGPRRRGRVWGQSLERR